MAARLGSVKTTYDIFKVIQPIYTGGDVSIDSSGRILASCLGEEAILTHLNTGTSLARIEGDGEILTALLITPQASHLIACSRSLSTKIYSLEPFQDDDTQIKFTLQKSLKPHATPVITAAVDRTGTLLATGSADGAIKIWDIRGGYASHNFRGHGGVISALYFFEVTSNEANTKQDRRSRPNGNTDLNGKNETANSRFRLASGSEDGKIRIWDLVKRKAIASLESHVSVVRSFDFSSRQHTLLSVSRDKTMTIWNTENWKVRKVIPVLESLESVGFLLDDRFVYTAGKNGILRIWETETAREVTREQRAGGEGDALLHVLYQSSLDFVLCVHADQTFALRSLAPLTSISGESTIDELPILRRISGTHDEIIDLAFVTPQKDLLALATNSEHIRLVSVATQTNGDSIAAGNYFGADIALLRGHEDIIISLDVDWSGCWIATGAKDNSARLWRIDHANGIYEAFTVLTGHAESIGAVSLPDQPPPPGSVAFDKPLENPPPFLITGSQDKTIKRWDISFKNRSKPRAFYTRKAHEKDINAIAINHQSTLFASASQDRLVKIWSVEEGEVQGVLRGHRRGVWTVQFAPKDTPHIGGDGGPISNTRGLVLTGSGDKTIKIWSLSDYSCLRTFEGHTNSVLKVLWIPLASSAPESHSLHFSTKRSPQIASAGGDGLVKIWDASSGECSCTLDNHTDRIWALTANPITTALVSGGGDGIVTFWTDSTERTLAATAAASTARIEESQELENHVHAGRYREAIALALALNHPARLLVLFTAVGNTPTPDPASRSGLIAVDQVLGQLGDEQLFTLLLRLRDWNANARTAPVAQRILGVVVRAYPAARLTALRGRKSGGTLKDVLEALRAYTERHYRRMEELVDESFLVDYTLREMEEGGFIDGADGVDGDVIMV